MIDCEIHGVAGLDVPIRARFAILPRIGEQILIHVETPGGPNSSGMRSFTVKRILHVDLNVWKKDAASNVQLWVERDALSL